MDELVVQAIALLPAVGQSVEFEAYKANLYAAIPDNGRDVFAHLIKKDLVGKKLSRDKDGNIVVMLSRKAA